MPVRLGLIGFGPWGKVVLRSLCSSRAARITRIASRNPATPALVGPKIRVTDDWRSLIRARDIDGIIVASPPALHFAMTSAAVERGLPVFVEKPLTLDIRSARKLLALTARKKGFVLVDHIHLFHPGFRALKKRSTKLLPLRKILTWGGNRGPVRPDVDSLWDVAPHDISMTLDLLGHSPETVTVSRRRSKILRGAEMFVIDLGFSSGVRARLTVGNGMSQKRRRFEAHGEDGGLAYDEILPDQLTRLPKGAKRWKPLPFTRRKPLTAAFETFAEAIRSGSTDLSSLERGVDVISILSRCDKSLGI